MLGLQVLLELLEATNITDENLETIRYSLNSFTESLQLCEFSPVVLRVSQTKLRLIASIETIDHVLNVPDSCRTWRETTLRTQAGGAHSLHPGGAGGTLTTAPHRGEG